MDFLKRVFYVLKKGSDLAGKAVSALDAALVFGCFLAVFFQVINRYILVKQTLFHWNSVTWTDELSRFLLVGITYFSLGQIYKYGQMSRADMVYSRLKPAAKKALYLMEFAMIAVFLGAMIRYGLEFAGANRIYRSEMLRIPGNILYLMPVAGAVLISYELITELFGVLCGEVQPFESLARPEEDTTDAPREDGKTELLGQRDPGPSGR